MGTVTIGDKLKPSRTRQFGFEDVMTALVESHDCGYFGVQWTYLQQLTGLDNAVFSEVLDRLIMSGTVDVYETTSKDCNPPIKRVIRLNDHTGYERAVLDESEILS